MQARRQDSVTGGYKQILGSAVAAGGGGQGGRAPPHLTTACAPLFQCTQNTFFGASRNDKITGNNRKRNNHVHR